MRAHLRARQIKRAVARGFTLSMVCWLGVALSGCDFKSVADDVTQREANEIVAVLGKSDISSDTVKQRGAKGRYAVVVNSSDFAAAAATLTRLGLPAEKRPGFDELTSGNGIIPPSHEVEALRLDRALAVELEELFLSRGDLSQISVIVRSHSCRSGERPMVTVLAQRLGEAQVDATSLREVARRAVPGISPDDVYVSVSDGNLGVGAAAKIASTTQGEELVSFLGFWRVPANDHAGAVLAVLGLLLITAGLSVLAGYIFGQFNWLNRSTALSAGQGGRKVDSPGAERRSDVQ
jgi:type III secretory pathway lipoprotein EscJ